MKELSDSGIKPLSHVVSCMTSGLTAYGLSKLNIIAVTESFPVSEGE